MHRLRGTPVALRSGMRRHAKSRLGSLLVLGLALVSLEGCALHLSPADEARSQFSASTFCPLHRVEAGLLVSHPEPPPKIAHDPERYAMWRAAYERKASEKTRQLVAVSGCDEPTTVYVCSSLLARDTTGRRSRMVYLGSTCNERSKLESSREQTSRNENAEASVVQ
jgi:hypothetical protein